MAELRFLLGSIFFCVGAANKLLESYGGRLVQARLWEGFKRLPRGLKKLIYMHIYTHIYIYVGLGLIQGSKLWWFLGRGIGDIWGY